MPSRNVLLAGSACRGGFRNASHDAAGPRPAGRIEKARKGLITPREAAEEIGQTERHVRRLLKPWKDKGDKAIVHALRGQPSNRKLDEKIKQTALEILSRGAYLLVRLCAPMSQRRTRNLKKLPSGGVQQVRAVPRAFTTINCKFD